MAVSIALAMGKLGMGRVGWDGFGRWPLAVGDELAVPRLGLRDGSTAARLPRTAIDWCCS